VTAVSEPLPRVGDYLVGDLARLTGTTVRTIRWYQSEGLLPPPRRAGRTARYGDDHVARLEVIRDLQARGLTLTAVRRLIERAPEGSATVALTFVRSAVTPASEDDAEVVTPAEAGTRLRLRPHEELDPGLLEELGLVRILDDDRWQVLAPAALTAAAELAELGVPLDRRIQITRLLRQHTQAMAEAVVELFLEYLWRPASKGAETDPAAWEALAAAVASLRPLATTSVAAFFDAALGSEAEAAAERELA
jgi:DNA-binding transcriptional MerR regulator